MKSSRTRRFFLSVLALGMAGPALAADGPAPGFFDFLNAPHDYWAQKFASFVGGLDRFFADERSFQETNNSVFRLDLNGVVQEGGERLLFLAPRARVSLPNTEKRLHLMLETDPEQTATGKTLEGKRPVMPGDAAGPSTYAAAVRLQRGDEGRWHFSSDAGIKLRGKLEPFARLRGSYTLPVGSWRIKLTESLFWFNTIGAGEFTQLDIEHIFSDPLLFRATSNATWLLDKRQFDLRQDFSLFQTLSDRNVLLYQVIALGESEPSPHVTEYVALVRLRHRVHRDWLFTEVSPEMHYPREEEFHLRPMLVLRAEMLFSGRKAGN